MSTISSIFFPRMAISFTLMLSAINAIAQDIPHELQQSFEAHGGLLQWNSQGTLIYTLESSSGTEKSREEYIINLHNRHERIKGVNYEMGFDGDQYWQWLKEEGLKEKNPRFFTNLQFYFFAMPFVLADPGVNYESLGLSIIGGKEYHGVKMTFDSGIGEAPEDQYLLFLDKESYRLKILLYSVTYFDKSRAEKYSARYYKEWQQVSGLWVPKEVIRHEWISDTKELGKERGKVTFPSVAFETQEPNNALFAPPAGAKVEPK